MKKLITLISSEGKTKKELVEEAIKQLKGKGYLKNTKEKTEELEIIFMPTKHKKDL